MLPSFFSREEYDERGRKTRECMRERGIDALLLTKMENIFYLTNFQTPGDGLHILLFASEEGEDCIFTRRLESTNAKHRSHFLYEPYDDNDREDAYRRVGERVKRLGRVAVGLEEGSLPCRDKDW